MPTSSPAEPFGRIGWKNRHTSPSRRPGHPRCQTRIGFSCWCKRSACCVGRGDANKPRRRDRFRCVGGSRIGRPMGPGIGTFLALPKAICRRRYSMNRQELLATMAIPFATGINGVNKTPTHSLHGFGLTTRRSGDWATKCAH